MISCNLMIIYKFFFNLDLAFKVAQVMQAEPHVMVLHYNIIVEKRVVLIYLNDSLSATTGINMNNLLNAQTIEWIDLLLQNANYGLF